MWIEEKNGLLGRGYIRLDRLLGPHERPQSAPDLEMKEQALWIQLYRAQQQSIGLAMAPIRSQMTRQSQSRPPVPIIFFDHPFAERHESRVILTGSVGARQPFEGEVGALGNLFEQVFEDGYRSARLAVGVQIGEPKIGRNRLTVEGDRRLECFSSCVAISSASRFRADLRLKLSQHQAVIRLPQP
jgi:hypothetical protein